MFNSYLTPEALTAAAESALDEIIIGLLAGEPEAATRWLTEAPAMLQHAPGYNVPQMIEAAIRGGRAYDQQFTPAT